MGDHPQKGLSDQDCERMSDGVGALSYDAFGTACWKVFGKAVQINPLEHSIEEGFMVTNFNLHANGKVKPAQTSLGVKGPKTLGI